MRQHNDLARISSDVSGLALRELLEIWDALEGADPEDVRDGLLDMVPALVEEHGAAAGEAVAEWYEDEREKALGVPGEPRLSEVEYEAVEGSIRWAARDLFVDGQQSKTLDKLEAVVDRHVHQQSRETLIASIEADTKNVRYARMMRGRETCGWCRMLASRGFVYRSEDSAGGNHAWGHDRCQCEVVPDFSLTSGEHEEYQREIDSLYEQYDWVRRRLEDNGVEFITDQAIADEWRKNIVDYDSIRDELAQIRETRSSDGTVPHARWDDYRRDALERLASAYEDGFTYGRRIPPRNPAQRPPGWPKGGPQINAKRWNHILYGERGHGGHMAGYGWINPMPDGENRTEFPENWGPEDISEAVLETIRNGTTRTGDNAITYRRRVGDLGIMVAVGNRASGPIVLSARLD